MESAGGAILDEEPKPELLERVRTGDQAAQRELTPTLYAELHRIASRHFRAERSHHTLQTTALVHEAYMKLAGGGAQEFQGDVHFLAVASRVMRQVLIDYARSRSTKKRSSGGAREPLWKADIEVIGEGGAELVDLIALDDALQSLAAENPQMAQVIEMRFFGGMTAEETATALGKSVHVVRHDLRFAQAWLRRKLSPSAQGGP